MPSQLTRRILATAAIAASTGCALFGGDATNDGTVNFSFSFCDFTAPQWVAYQNEGREWQFITAPDRVVSFKATPRLGLAFGSGSLSTSSVATVYFATVTELETADCKYHPTPPSRQLNGSVKGVHAGQEWIVATRSNGFRQGSTDSAFSISVMEGADLLAVLRTKGSPSIASAALRVIRRTGIALPANATVPALDFDAPEALPFDSASITFAGTTKAGNRIMVADGAVINLWPVGLLQTSTHYIAPTSVLGDSGYHEFLIEETPDNYVNNRTQVYQYRTAKDTTITMAPYLIAAPTLTVLSASPCRRLRASLAWQPEYSSSASAVFSVALGQYNLAAVTVRITRAYLGETSSSWVMDVPDLRMGAGGDCLLPSAGTPYLSTNAMEGPFGPYPAALGYGGMVAKTRRWASR